MEILFEFIFELIFEGAVTGMGNKKVPFLLRVLLFLFVAIIFVFVISACIGAGILSWNDGKYVVASILIGLGIAFLIFSIMRCMKYVKHKEIMEDDIR